MLAAAGSAVGVGTLWRFPYLAAKDGGGRRGGRAVLRHGDLRHADLLHLGARVDHGQLRRDLPLGAQKGRAHPVGHLSCGLGRDRAGLQRVLLRGAAAQRLGRAAAQRLGRAAAGHHGLHQQQRHDVVHRPAVDHPHRLDQDARLCDRRDGTQRRAFPPQERLPRHDPLHRAVHSVPSSTSTASSGAK